MSIGQEQRGKRNLSSKSKKIQPVIVKKSSWEKLKELAHNPKWVFPALSCNEYHDVWYDVTYGFHQLEDRKYVSKEDFPFIKKIIENVLNIKPQGGRFHIRKDDVCLTSSENYKVVCKIKFK